MISDREIYAALALIIILCGLATIGMAFYLGRSKVKEVDRFIHGFEIPGDSIFFQIMRIPHYGGVFAWSFYARRCQLVQIREQFDKKFQRPFIIAFCLGWSSFIGMILLYFLDKFFLHVT